MLSSYVRAAMHRARYEKLEDGPEAGFWAEIPDCPGTWATGPTLEAARDELRSVLEGWIEIKLRRDHNDFAVLDGIDLNRPAAAVPAAALAEQVA